MHSEQPSAQAPFSSLSKALHTASTVGTALGHYGKDEWAYRTAHKDGQAQVRLLSHCAPFEAVYNPFFFPHFLQKPSFPRPSLATHHRTNSAPLSSFSSAPPPQPPARKLPPPPRPVFPLSPPDSPEVAQSLSRAAAQRSEKPATLSDLVSEEDELERALKASLLDKPVKVPFPFHLLRRTLTHRLTLLADRSLLKTAKKSSRKPSSSRKRSRRDGPLSTRRKSRSSKPPFSLLSRTLPTPPVPLPPPSPALRLRIALEAPHFPPSAQPTSTPHTIPPRRLVSSLRGAHRSHPGREGLTTMIRARWKCSLSPSGSVKKKRRRGGGWRSRKSGC
jgi:hypothetical protein